MGHGLNQFSCSNYGCGSTPKKIHDDGSINHVVIDGKMYCLACGPPKETLDFMDVVFKKLYKRNHKVGMVD